MAKSSGGAGCAASATRGGANPYMNEAVRAVDFLTPVVDAWRERLMPPQFNELLSALGGETSEKTRDYWLDKMRQMAEGMFDSGDIGEMEYTRITNRLRRLQNG